MKNFRSVKNINTEEIKSLFFSDNELEEYLIENKDWREVKSITVHKIQKDWYEKKVIRVTDEELYVFLKENPQWIKRIPPPLTTGVLGGDWNWREKMRKTHPGFCDMMKNKFSPMAPEKSEFRQKWG